MAKRYMTRDNATGLYKLVEATVVSSGVLNSGDIVALDGSGRLDLSVLPVGVGPDTYAGIAAENLASGDFVYINSSAEVAKASAGVSGVPARGFVLDAFNASATALVYFEGRNTALSGLTPGSNYFLSDSTPGAVTSTPVAEGAANAGKKHQRVGDAVTATTLNFEPSEVIILA
jgi:hypothetical protein